MWNLTLFMLKKMKEILYLVRVVVFFLIDFGVFLPSGRRWEVCGTLQFPKVSFSFSGILAHLALPLQSHARHKNACNV